MKWNYRTYGILCVPVKEGRYPALLRVPGAGVRPYGGDIYTASQGAITLEIGIHGISVTMEQKVYDDVFNGALMNYWNWGMDNRDDSYYKRVIIGCLRALDYIEHEMYNAPDGNTHTLSGVNGTTEVKHCSIKFSSEEKSYKADFLVADMNEAFGMIRRHHCITIHGMLGSKFLRSHNIVLDFQNLSAYSKDDCSCDCSAAAV
jgi:hypothetical protein